jgi:hypothetical protein
METLRTSIVFERCKWMISDSKKDFFPLTGPNTQDFIGGGGVISVLR